MLRMKLQLLVLACMILSCCQDANLSENVRKEIAKKSSLTPLSNQLLIRLSFVPGSFEKADEVEAFLLSGLQGFLDVRFGKGVRLKSTERHPGEFSFGGRIPASLDIEGIENSSFSACYHEVAHNSLESNILTVSDFAAHNCGMRTNLGDREFETMFFPDWAMKTQGHFPDLLGFLASHKNMKSAKKWTLEQSEGARYRGIDELVANPLYRFSEERESRGGLPMQVSCDLQSNWFEIGFGAKWARKFESRIRNTRTDSVALLVDGWQVFSFRVHSEFMLYDNVVRLSTYEHNRAPCGYALLGILVSTGFMEIELAAG